MLSFAVHPDGDQLLGGRAMRKKRIDSVSVLIIGTVVLILTMLITISCSKSNDRAVKSGKRTLYLYNWTYYTPDEVIDRFEKEFNVDVVLDVYASNEDMFTKLRTSGTIGYDIVVPSADYASIMIHLDMLHKIDHSKIPNLKHIDPWVTSLATYDPNLDYTVPYFLGAAGIAVNTKHVKEYEKDWSIFGNPEFKGKMQLLDDMVEVLGIAQKTLGYSVNSRSAEEIAAAGRFINEQWKPNIVKFDSEGFGKAFARGEFWISHAFPEVIFEELPKSRWSDIDFFLPENGGPMYLDSMVILKDAPNADIAHEFINFFHRPDIYALFLDEFYFAPTVNPDAEKYMETSPFYRKEDLEHYELKLDMAEALEIYDSVWQTVRYY
jgi:spermidine/putrescine transport system substrate-binding protein